MKMRIQCVEHLKTIIVSKCWEREGEDLKRITSTHLGLYRLNDTLF
jgi:hypothetical protein